MTGLKAERLSPAEQKRADQAAYERATQRDGGRCQRCLRDCGPIARDHRQNRELGNTVASNLQLLGLRCHQWKTEHPKDANAEGWGVPRNIGDLAPADIPARRWFRTWLNTHRLGWVLYDDLGGFTEIDEREAAFRREKAGVA